MPYRCMFGSEVFYLGLDFPTRGMRPNSDTCSTVFGNVMDSPIKRESVDLVLCTQVLEHVEKPAAVISEIERILKVRGTVILSTHGVFPFHACPNDFWRWTDSGLKKMFERFGNVRVIPANTTIGTFAYLLEDQIHFHLPFTLKQPSIRGLCGLALRWVVNVSGDVSQKIRPDDSGGRPLIGVYVVVAEKKERVQGVLPSPNSA